MSTIPELTPKIDRDHSRWADRHPRAKRWNCATCNQPARLYARGPRCDDCLNPAPAVAA